MTERDKNRNQRDTIIAAAVTFVAALVILLLLFCGSINYDRNLLALDSTPEISLLTPDDEEFIEPEIIRDLGEPDATQKDEPAPAFQGQPRKADTENDKLIIPGKNEKPAPPVEKNISQTKPSPVKTSEPPKTDEKKQEVTSKMAGKFSPRNGSESGSSNSSGAGGTGVGISGSVAGRTFKGCPKPNVALQNKVVVEVKVTIDAAGRVISAQPRSRSGNASTAILNACAQAAKSARWSEDPNTPSARGSITFTITPK
ncbi:MAG: hypothetical protein K2M87_05205 [Muribaculaceae bacterium]|nr:hypothetical protein [Muribaculaceae bacterium]